MLDAIQSFCLQKGDCVRLAGPSNICFMNLQTRTEVPAAKKTELSLRPCLNDVEGRTVPSSSVGLCFL